MSLYSDAILALTPSAYWRLGEPAGTVALDQRWLSHGTYVPTVTLGQAGAISQDNDTGVLLNGTTGHVLVADNANLDYGNGPITVNFWFRRGNATSTLQILWSKGTQGNIYFLNSKLEMDNDSSAIVRSAGTVTDSAWHMGTISRSTVGAGNTKMYIDGVDVTTEVNPGNNIVTNATNLRLGIYADGVAFPFVGGLDEVAQFPVALTATQVASLYATATSTASPNFDAITAAIVARFAPANVTPPAGGYDNIRVSTGNLPNQMTPLPTVLVFPESGDFIGYPGKRDSSHEFVVRFYYNQTGDLARDTAALRAWLPILTSQLRASAMLGGLVTRSTVDAYEMGIFSYAGLDYSGIELTCSVIVNEPWSAVA